MSETCGSCRFFRRGRVGQPFGVCRERPPTVLLLGFNQDSSPRTDGFWPPTVDHEWCGYFAPRGNGKVDVVPVDLEAEPAQGVA